MAEKYFPNQRELKDAFEYHPDGYLRWRDSPGNQVKKNKRAGTLMNTGYRRITFKGVKFLEHKLVWTYHYQFCPEMLYHANRRRADNRIENLRKTNRMGNGANSKMRSDNTSGYRGVTKDKGSWRAQISIRGEMVKLGSFATEEQAAKVYNIYAKRYFKHWATLNVDKKGVEL